MDKNMLKRFSLENFSSFQIKNYLDLTADNTELLVLLPQNLINKVANFAKKLNQNESTSSFS
jgi:hypothetical protein